MLAIRQVKLSTKDGFGLKEIAKIVEAEVA